MYILLIAMEMYIYVCIYRCVCIYKGNNRGSLELDTTRFVSNAFALGRIAVNAGIKALAVSVGKHSQPFSNVLAYLKQCGV